MIFSDRDLLIGLQKGIFSVSPVCEDDIQPASIDLHLYHELKTIDGTIIPLTDEGYHLKPLEFILGATNETVRIGEKVSSIVNGKSSLARKGLMVHVTAGYIDPGFYGNITLELFNCSDKEIILNKNMKICQLIIEALSNPVVRPYGSEGLGSHYQGSRGVVNSRL